MSQISIASDSNLFAWQKVSTRLRFVEFSASESLSQLIEIHIVKSTATLPSFLTSDP